MAGHWLGEKEKVPAQQHASPGHPIANSASHTHHTFPPIFTFFLNAAAEPFERSADVVAKAESSLMRIIRHLYMSLYGWVAPEPSS